MKKIVFLVASVLTLCFSGGVLAQIGGSFMSCQSVDECDVNIGSNHASVYGLYGKSYYRLDVSDFTLGSNSNYINYLTGAPNDTATYNLGGFDDMFYSGYITGNVCMGGSSCGYNTSIYLPVPESEDVFTDLIIEKVEVTGHDNIGSETKAGLALYEGSVRLDLIDVKSAGDTYTFTVDRPISEPLRLTSIGKDGNTSSGDETAITKIKIFLSSVPSDPGLVARYSSTGTSSAIESCDWTDWVTTSTGKVRSLYCDGSKVLAAVVGITTNPDYCWFPWSDSDYTHEKVAGSYCEANIYRNNLIWPASGESCDWEYRGNWSGYDYFDFNCSGSGTVASKTIAYFPGSYSATVDYCKIDANPGFVVETVGTGNGDTECDIIEVKLD
ncbi:MAG: hypothetical protein ACI93R_003546 [Flavobacteriales bacterium]|jgi:hypothetical protein